MLFYFIRLSTMEFITFTSYNCLK
uniref:Uncharacterized protein n=1 Tax=Arundo donax TaxID=35708 RepID=A0A0A9E9X0_ARUDO